MKFMQSESRTEIPSAPLHSVTVLESKKRADAFYQRETELQAEVELWKERASRLSASETAAHAYASSLQEKIAFLQAEVSGGGEYVNSLLQQLGDERTSAAVAGSELARLADTIARKDQEMERLRREIEATRKSAIADKIVTAEYISALKARLKDLELTQEATEEMRARVVDFLVAVQDERLALGQLIDAVQASRFWSLKAFVLRQKQRVRNVVIKLRVIAWKRPDRVVGSGQSTNA